MNAITKQQETQGLYHYVECGLDNVYLEGGFEIVESPYGRGVTVKDLDGLHRCIAQCLVNKPAPLTGAEFRFLRTELDLSQAVMGKLCGRQERMVRQWETREELVEDPANFLIRFIYQQRYNPSANYEEVTKQIIQLQALDKQLCELTLIRTKDEGWKPSFDKVAA